VQRGLPQVVENDILPEMSLSEGPRRQGPKISDMFFRELCYGRIMNSRSCQAPVRR